jgi:3-hydroxyisobutyrate dehydrogenase-like beta-hydroxyacid dehydrogenase
MSFVSRCIQAGARSRIVVGNRNLMSRFSSSGKVGFVGLGHMGSKMVKHIADNGHPMLVFDRSKEAMVAMEKSAAAGLPISVASSVQEIAENCDVVISMLPNDVVVSKISLELLEHAKSKDFVHVSCSTVSPSTSRQLAAEYKAATNPCTFIASPVFARPDGVTRKEATWMVSGSARGKAEAHKYLTLMGRVEDYGEDAGAANVVKLCGNFLISSSIEAIGEAMALAEKNGVPPRQVMDLLSSTIFDCLIYKVREHVCPLCSTLKPYFQTSLSTLFAGIWPTRVPP